MSLSAIFSLARTLRDEEELGKVVEMSVSLLEKLERVSGNDGEYSNTINAMNNLAVALRDKGRIREAAAIQKAVLENLGRTLEDDQTDPLTIIAMNNLAVILRDQGKLDEASMMQRRVVVGQERIHGKDHHLTVVAMNNLAWTLKEEGKLEEAAAMQQEVLEKRRRILGNEHASTVLAMNNLAAMLADQGKINEATDMQQEVLEKRQRILGGEHHDTLAAMNNLATMLRDQGKVGEAATMQTEALEMQRRVLGDRHPTTIIALNNLALILTRRGSLEKAMKMLEEVLDVRQRILGDSHPDTIEAMINFARILQKQGKPDVAVVMFDEAFVKQQQVLGDNHPSTIMTISYGASAMLDQGILDDAVLVQTIALEKLTEILGEGHPKTITLLSNLASMIIRQEKLEEATIMFKTALEQMERIVEEGHPDVITIMGNLLYALQRQGKLDEAAVISQSLEERKHVHQMHESFSFDFALGGNIGNGLGSLTLHLIEAQQPRMSRFQPPRIGSRLVFRPADTQRPRESTSRPYGGESDKSVSEEHSASDRLAKDDLCEACRKITLEGLGCLAEIVPKLRWVEEYRAEYDLTKVHGYEYPHTVGDLDDLCRHCKLCNRIRKTIYHDNDPFTIASRDKTSRFKLSFFMQNGTGCLKIHLESATNSKLNAQKNAAPFLLRLFSDPEKEENFAHLALGRSIVPPDSETAFRRIQSSLEHCLVNHPMCSRTLSGTVVHQESTLPTRVIDVCLDNSSDIRIQETAGLYGKYVALSYCWGESSGFPELMLTKATIDQLKLNLPVESLPKTIRDAINITQRLGMNYLWVDRLCIIQDDQADWQNEAAKMGSVYENAVFTIAATGAHTPKEGCFLPREENALVATLPTERGNLYISCLMAPLNEELKVREFELEMSRSRWATRAWTFQERLFSRRVIYFGRQQITWECRKHRETETRFGSDAGFKYSCSKFLHAQDPKSTINWAIDRIAEKNSVDCERMDLSNLWSTAECRDGADWEGLIAMYSQLQLTYEKDRIPAIQSLMQHVAEASGLECCAGMWLGSLPRTLFWWPFWWDEREIERAIPSRRIFRTSTDGVPSWSWLAAGCPVSFYSWIRVDEMALERPKFILNHHPKLECCAHIVDGCRSGRAREPKIIKSFHQKWNSFPDSHWNGLLDRWESGVHDLIHRGSDAESDDPADGLVCFDDSKDPPESFKCAILGAGGGPVPSNPSGNDKISSNGLHIFMLVLKPTGSLDEYKRIGIAYRYVLSNCDYARNLPDKRLIRII